MAEQPGFWCAQDGQAGVRLADALAGRWPELHLVALRQWIAAGAVSVNGQTETRPGYRLRVGDVVGMNGEPERRLRGRDGRQSAFGGLQLYESADVMVLEQSLADPRLEPRWRIVHRLERGVTGVLLVATDAERRRLLGSGFVLRFAALVIGSIRENRIRIDAPLGPDRRRPGTLAVAAPGARGARPTTTVAHCRERIGGYSLLDVEVAYLPAQPVRKDQIRIHLASAGHPVVGDAAFHGGSRLLLSELKHNYRRRRGAQEKPLLDRMFLHATSVQFRSKDGVEHVVESGLPRELARALAALRRL